MLISEVIEEETGKHPGQFAESNLPCAGKLSWAIIQVNIDHLTLSDMHHVVFAGFQTQCTTRFPTYFLHSLNIR